MRAAYNNYFLASLSPWGNSFTFCDSLAASGSKIARNADVLMYHALFPNDVAGDFIYRSLNISSDYDNVGVKTVNTHHPFAVMDTLCCAIFATDLNPISWEDELAQTTKGHPLTYFSEGSGSLITRSDVGQGRALPQLFGPRHPRRASVLRPFAFQPLRSRTLLEHLPLRAPSA